MNNEVYITKTSHFLPNNPVSNDEMEDYLGRINNQPSKSRNIVLRNNGIKCRYYAVTKDGQTTHTNAEMVSLAVRAIFDNNPESLKNLELLCCGTSTPDQLMPSHGVMVHGWLPETNAIEVTSNSGVCCSGMHALKYAWMSVKLGQTQNAVSTGSERVSKIMRSDFFEEETSKLAEAEKNPYISFEKDFLRWMLSDGAGAFLLSNKKNDNGISLRIDFLEGVSYANIIEPCMYAGADKTENGSFKSYMEFSNNEIAENSVLSIKQDVKLLSQHIITLGIEVLQKMFEKHNFTSDDVDYFLPHISSNFFKAKMYEGFKENGIHFPPEKWFTNLTSVGNIGSGAIYVMLDELFNSGKLQKGQKIFISVPESARFSYMFGLFTVC